MGTELLPKFLRQNYEIHEWGHACAILKNDFPEEWNDIIEVLTNFRLKRSYILAPGGSKTLTTKELERAFRRRNWREKKVSTKRVVENAVSEVLESQTHEIDCFKGKVGLEIEWNSKDQTFDRDLFGFRMLFEIGRMSVGVIITRSTELQSLFNRLGEGKKYGASTIHIGKLLPRIKAGRSGGCPLLVFGIRKKLYVEE